MAEREGRKGKAKQVGEAGKWSLERDRLGQIGWQASLTAGRDVLHKERS